MVAIRTVHKFDFETWSKSYDSTIFPPVGFGEIDSSSWIVSGQAIQTYIGTTGFGKISCLDPVPVNPLITGHPTTIPGLYRTLWYPCSNTELPSLTTTVLDAVSIEWDVYTYLSLNLKNNHATHSGSVIVNGQGGMIGMAFPQIGCADFTITEPELIGDSGSATMPASGQVNLMRRGRFANKASWSGSSAYPNFPTLDWFRTGMFGGSGAPIVMYPAGRLTVPQLDITSANGLVPSDITMKAEMVMAGVFTVTISAH